MRIIYLHQYFNTLAMAGGTRSFEMARRLVAAGHEVNVVTTWRAPTGAKGWFSTTEEGVRVHWLPVPYSNDMSFAGRIRAFFRFAWAAAGKAASLPGDVVFATSTPLTIALPAIFASRRKRIPMVFEVRDMWPDVPVALGILRNPIFVWLARRLELFAYSRAAHVVALAPGMREDIIAKGIAAGKVSVITNGCDQGLFRPSSEDNSPRERNEWLSGRKLLIYAGAIGLANGVDYLVRLAREVYEIDPEIRFAVFGDGKEWGKVHALAVQKNVLNRNLFMHAALPKNQLSRWLTAADMHVALMRGPRSYLKNAANNKFFDALAAGKPIANNFEGWQSTVAVEEGVGLILDPADCAVAARQLVNALHDAAWLEKVPERARRLAEGPFSRDRLAAELEGLLASVVEQKPAA